MLKGKLRAENKELTTKHAPYLIHIALYVEVK